MRRRGGLGDLHEALLERFPWYNRWHAHRHYVLVHYAALATFLVFSIGTIRWSLLPYPGQPPVQADTTVVFGTTSCINQPSPPSPHGICFGDPGEQGAPPVRYYSKTTTFTYSGERTKTNEGGFVMDFHKIYLNGTLVACNGGSSCGGNPGHDYLNTAICENLNFDSNDYCISPSKLRTGTNTLVTEYWDEPNCGYCSVNEWGMADTLELYLKTVSGSSTTGSGSSSGSTTGSTSGSTGSSASSTGSTSGSTGSPGSTGSTGTSGTTGSPSTTSGPSTTGPTSTGSGPTTTGTSGGPIGTTGTEPTTGPSGTSGDSCSPPDRAQAGRAELSASPEQLPTLGDAVSLEIRVNPETVRYSLSARGSSGAERRLIRDGAGSRIGERAVVDRPIEPTTYRLRFQNGVSQCGYTFSTIERIVELTSLTVTETATLTAEVTDGLLSGSLTVRDETLFIVAPLNDLQINTVLTSKGGPVNLTGSIAEDGSFSGVAKLAEQAIPVTGQVRLAEEPLVERRAQPSAISRSVPPASAAVGLLTLPLLPALTEAAQLLFVGYVPRRKRRPWGEVVDESGIPVFGAQIQLANLGTKRIVASQTTDREGRFVFLISQPGQYLLKVTHPEYQSSLSQPFTVSDVSQPVADQKLTLRNLQLTTYPSVTRTSYAYNLQSKIWERLQFLHYPILLLGLIVNGLNVFVLGNQSVLPVTLFTAYGLLLFISLISRRLLARSYGMTVDAKTNQPLPLSFVRALTHLEGRTQVAATAVTDQSGRYRFLLKPGDYELVATKPAYQKLLLSQTVRRGKQLSQSLHLNRL